MISCVTSDGWAGLSQTYVFERLKEPDFFHRICVTEGFVSWPDEIDLAPDALYAAIKRDGEWILSGEYIFIRLTHTDIHADSIS
ncbi:DUF2442 domain-containing protein [Methylococcus capsulatus]|uniref:DUF2442 domain-containing protein n=1 Tax=Methylococcus capsulatus TaxID=414 RepID=UPI001C529E57|nr:DUF2442 domain-containing protein [Methylococcus capsulatus]QXP90544.1 DUF2442 domain-containing protein [Methylococcus capsulatus]QXP94888.1 DUF2442 domain-containing protein [Methylococcus capsulatus]